MKNLRNPYLSDIQQVFGSSKPPYPFVVDAEYNIEDGVVSFVVYADQWHSIPDTHLQSCSEWLSARLGELRQRGIPLILEKRDDSP